MSNTWESITLQTYVPCKVHTLAYDMHALPHARVVVVCFCKVYMWQLLMDFFHNIVNLFHIVVNLFRELIHFLYQLYPFINFIEHLFFFNANILCVIIF